MHRSDRAGIGCLCASAPPIKPSALVVLLVFLADLQLARADPFLGIAELPDFFGSQNANAPGGVQSPASPKPVQIYVLPRSDATILKVVNDPKMIESREFAYELPGAVVYDEQDGWYLIRYRDGPHLKKGWIDSTAVRRLLAFDALLTNALSYLTDDWDGNVHAMPNLAEVWAAARDVKSTNVLEVRKVNGQWWAKIELLSGEHCQEGYAEEVGVGWIPVFTKAGDLNVWFHSRAC